MTSGLICPAVSLPDLLSAFVDSSVGHRCEFCLKLYATRRILEIHISTVHLKQRPYPCGICHQTFTQRGTLNRHLRIHTGERFQSSACTCTACGDSVQAGPERRRSATQQQARLGDSDERRLIAA
ncbi:zinc finger protein-like [Tropilaelaps mercedesae]|uniref:Zinc finger protein-like n=1 Tax=Tropilaelaps mercedesae TaxID=418985 RepID=A0A1V9XIT3_9ACAR|nr:zinc finger protein-like [Tropilaelaps mercedesae]